jgi:hypothetical protein
VNGPISKVMVVDGTRKREAFSNPVINWRYRLFTGPRCPGLNSVQTYKSSAAALAAGNRMANKINGDNE